LQGAQNAENLGLGALTQGQSLGSAAASSNAQAAGQYSMGQNIANNANRAALDSGIAGITKTLTDPITQLINGLARGGNTGTNLSQFDYAALSGY